MNDKKNVVMAIALSMLVLLGWPLIQAEFFPAPPPPPQTTQSQSQPQTSPSPGQSSAVPGEEAGIPSIPGAGETTTDPAVSRDQALTRAPRVYIDTPRLSGSINLRGARIDDLILKDYHQTIQDGSPMIDLLQPSGGDNPYFAQFGWTATDGLEVPTGEAVWSADGTTLSPETPVTLTWANPAGVVFEQVLAIDRNFMFTVTQRVVNTTDATVTAVPYGRIFRASKPETENFYILHEGLLGVFNGKLEERDYGDLEDEPGRQESFATTGGWMGITDKYWLVALVPDPQASVTSTFLETRANAPQYHVNYVMDLDSIPAGQTAEHTGRLFAGAKETTLLDRYGEEIGITNFDLAVDFGWFYFLTKPIFYAIHWLNGVLGNFGLAILVLTIGIKIAFFPLANKSYRSMSKMKLLQPKIVEMRERVGDDKQKLQQEMMALYKKEKVNPLAGCLPVLVQIPVFFALYKVLFVTIEMRHAPFFGWIQDLSAPDPLGMLTLFGLIDWTVPGILVIFNIGLWPLIMGFTMWFQQKLNPPPADPIQQKVFALMPIFFTFILGTFPAGLVIYWAWNNSLSILQQYIIMRKMGVAIGGGPNSATPAASPAAPGKIENKTAATEDKEADDDAPAPKKTVTKKQKKAPTPKPARKVAKRPTSRRAPPKATNNDGEAD